MRANNPGRLPPHVRQSVTHYPARSDRHPVYLFGHFDLGGPPLDSSSGLDEALLGIMEAAQSRRGGAGPTHIAHHRSEPTEETHSFMFGMDPEQPRPLPWEEPYFAFGPLEDAE